ncbi:MAG: hypothetical protein ABL919_01015 [Methylococcales bacterium]|nr:hypothetical protein [Methylococcaceae bacterium]
MIIQSIFKAKNLVTALVACFILLVGIDTAKADLCKNVKFKFTNNHSMGRKISVDKIMYWDKSDNIWRTEDVKPDTECDINDTCYTDEEDLEHVENEVIEKVRFIYKELADGKWTDNIEGGNKLTNDNGECVKGKIYDGFTITGKS